MDKWVLSTGIGKAVCPEAGLSASVIRNNTVRDFLPKPRFERRILEIDQIL